jgi:hypothetical protein
MRGTLKETAARPGILKWQFSGHKSGGTVVVPLLLAVRVPFLPRRPCVSVGPTDPDADVHGRVADGGGPEFGKLGTANARAAGETDARERS